MLINYQNYQEKSLIMLIINGIGYYCGLGYVLTKELNAFWLFFNYISGLIMTFLCVVMWLIYKGEKS